jgi:hypothetical protein
LNDKNTNFDHSFFGPVSTSGHPQELKLFLIYWTVFFFGLKYLPHICEMDLNKPVQCSGLMGETQEKFLSIGKWGQSKRWVASHFATFSHFKRTSKGPEN